MTARVTAPRMPGRRVTARRIAPVRRPAAALAAGLAALAGAGGLAGCGAGDGPGLTVAPEPEPELLGPGRVTVTLDVEHSRFVPDELRVVAGTEVRFVLANGDPINHELIVGPPDVHARHESGTHARHGPVPGEVSVGPNDEAATTYRFDEPGTVEFACHLPGHYDYGMRGTVEVVPA
ncbi:MAG TPA: plastocyanin/azurin family copper-binding protein [Acidimicrobiales bacterium]